LEALASAASSHCARLANKVNWWNQARYYWWTYIN
jgi:hypothetical protein